MSEKQGQKMSEELTERDWLVGGPMDFFIRALAEREEEDDMTSTGDLLNRLGGGDEDESMTPAQKRLCTAQEKASLAHEVFDLVVPYSTIVNPLPMGDIAEVLEDVAKQIRNAQYEDGQPPF